MAHRPPLTWVCLFAAATGGNALLTDEFEPAGREVTNERYQFDPDMLDALIM